jgi:hypothetical protein
MTQDLTTENAKEEVTIRSSHNERKLTREHFVTMLRFRGPYSEFEWTDNKVILRFPGVPEKGIN